MQSIILDRRLGKLRSLEFGTTITETFYSNLSQSSKKHVFPPNCHSSAAVNSLSIESNEYRYMISGCADSSIKIWDLKDETEYKPAGESRIGAWEDFEYDVPERVFVQIASIPKKTAHEYGVSYVQWWPFDTGMFVSASFDHKVNVWDTNELTPVHQFDLDSRIYSFDICGDVKNPMDVSALIAVASDGPFVRLLDLRSSSSAHTLQGHKGKTLCVKWHPSDHSILATGGFDGEVKIWDIRRSKSCLCRLDMLRKSPSNYDTSDNLTRASVKAHSGPVNGMVWDTRGHMLYTTGNDDKIRVWDMISSLSPPINKLINFGPLVRNRYIQTIPLVLNPIYETELQYLLFPSDNDDVLLFRTIDAKLVSRLRRKGSKRTGRTSSIAYAGPFSATYFCGTLDGEIVGWSPKYNNPPLSSVQDLESISSFDIPPFSANEKTDINVVHEKSKLYSDPYFKHQ